MFSRWIFLFIFALPLFSANRLEHVTLQLKWIDQFQFAGYYMAKEKGFYAQEGLEVELLPYNPKESIAQKVLEQKVDFGIDSASIMVQIANNKEVLLLASIFQSSPLVLMALQDSGIKKFDDFKNKKILLTDDQQFYLTLQAMLKSHDISLSDVRIVQDKTYDIKNLIDKKADLMVAYTTNEPFVLKEMGYASTIFDPKEYGFDFYEEILFTSQKLFRQNPELVDKFYRASLKGWLYAYDHIEESAQIVHDKYNTTHKSYQAILFEANEMKKLSFQKNVPFGSITPEKLGYITQNYKLMGYIKTTPSLDGYIYNPYHNLLSDEERKYLASKKEITYCIDRTKMPYEGIMGDKHIGITSEILEKLSSILEIPFTMGGNDCDLVTLEEKSSANSLVTRAYLSADLALVAKGSESYANQISELNGKKISFVAGSQYIDRFKKIYPNIEFVKVGSTEEGLNAVARGEVFAHMDMLQCMVLKIQSDYYKVLSIIHKFKERIPFSMGIKKGDEQLLKIIDKAIGTINSREIDAITAKYTTVEVIERIDNTLLYKILIAFSFISTVLILLILYYRYKVKKESEKIMFYQTAALEQKKMASLGYIMGLIAHQWRQPLNELTMSQNIVISKIQNNKITDELLYQKLDHQKEVLEFLNQTVDNFQTFFDDDETMEYIDLNETLKKVTYLFNETLKNDNVVLNIASDLHCETFISSNSMIQVLLSLMQNSHHFLMSRMIVDPWIKIEIRRRKSSVIIIMEDNAGGIKNGVSEELFFSNVSANDDNTQSTGMGLYMVKVIIEGKFNGKISVENSEYGARFTIELPS